MSRGESTFRKFCIPSCLTTCFGALSVAVGVTEMCIWLAQIGVFGLVQGVDREDNYLKESHGGVSGAGMAFVVACGLWCGIWVTLTGVCGCCIRPGRSTDKNNRTRIVLCLASACNAVLFCPIQIALYSWVFTPEDAWIIVLPGVVKPVWWMITFQALGIASGAASLIISIINIVVAMKTKIYSEQSRHSCYSTQNNIIPVNEFW